MNRALTTIARSYGKLLKWQLVGLAFWTGGCVFEAILLTSPKLVHLLIARIL